MRIFILGLFKSVFLLLIGLKLDKANNVMNNYPIVNTQWMKIGHFQKRISQHLHNDLQKNNLTAEVSILSKKINQLRETILE